MPRFSRNLVILAKAEVTYGTDPVPTGAANAILIANPSVTPIQANNVDRDLVRAYFGASEQLVGTKTRQLGFDVELVGSGTAGTAPAWGPLLKACAFSEAITADQVDYLPVTDTQASVTIWIYDSGVLHKMSGARGNVVFKLNAGEKPVMSFTFTGLYGLADSAVGLPTTDYSTFKTPQVPTNANTMPLVLGATYSGVAAPTLTGGTVVPSLGLEIDAGNSVQFTPLIGGETVDVTQRSVSGRLRLDLTPAQEISRMADVLDTVLSSVGISHGLTVGNKVLLFMPSVQFINPAKEDLNGRRLIGYELRGVPLPAGTGNDELRIVTSF